MHQKRKIGIGVGALAIALVILCLSWRDVPGQLGTGRYGELRDRPLPLNWVISTGHGDFGIQEYHYRLDTDMNTGTRVRSFTTISFGPHVVQTRLSASSLSSLAAASFGGITFLALIATIGAPNNTS